MNQFESDLHHAQDGENAEVEKPNSKKKANSLDERIARLEAAVDAGFNSGVEEARADILRQVRDLEAEIGDVETEPIGIVAYAIANAAFAGLAAFYSSIPLAMHRITTAAERMRESEVLQAFNQLFPDGINGEMSRTAYHQMMATNPQLYDEVMWYADGLSGNEFFDHAMTLTSYVDMTPHSIIDWLAFHPVESAAIVFLLVMAALFLRRMFAMRSLRLYLSYEERLAAIRNRLQQAESDDATEDADQVPVSEDDLLAEETEEPNRVVASTTAVDSGDDLSSVDSTEQLANVLQRLQNSNSTDAVISGDEQLTPEQQLKSS